MKPVIFAISFFSFVIAIIVIPIVNQPEPKQPLFKNEVEFIASLQRYTKAYHKIESESLKQHFANAYLKTILRDILILPVVNNTDNIQVILAREQEGQTVIVLKEIQLGPDNGLHEAMYRIVFEQHQLRPPFYSEELGDLLEEVVGGS